MPRSVVPLVVLCLFSVPTLLAQVVPTAVCNFDPSTQLAVKYQPISVNTSKPVFGREVPYNKVWAPGGMPMIMFLNHPITVDGKEIPVGAYTMFVVPAENKWTLIISRSTDTSGKYDEHQDLVRVPMQWGELSSPESTFSIYFAHLAPGQCTMRLDLNTTRAWVDFQNKK
jgi:hypothetical protein